MNNCWIEISAPALQNNLNVLSKKMRGSSELMFVVKSNAYGHGLTEVSQITKYENTIDWFAVFDFKDALQLRQKTKKPILVLFNTTPDLWKLAVKYDITVTISTLSSLKKLALSQYKKKLSWHLKVDTGLCRQGLLESDINQVVALFNKHNYHPKGLYSHFSGIEDALFDSYSFKQYTSFMSWKDALSKIHIHPKLHISGTSGTLRYDQFNLDIVRVGIGAYGLWTSEKLKNKMHPYINLKPVLSLKSRVSEIKYLLKGSKIAYDCTYTLKRDSRIAVLPVGYWDGIPRSLSSNGTVLIRGKRAHIIGRIMMNMCVIDITEVDGVKPGDIVTFIGKDKKQEITVDELACQAKTINYEIVTRLNPSIQRIITGLQKKTR
jgi:alanine racemase